MDVQGPGRQRPYISQHDPRNENIRMNTINNVYIETRGSGRQQHSQCAATATVFRWLTSSTYNIVTSVTHTNTIQVEKYAVLVSAQFSLVVTFDSHPFS